MDIFEQKLDALVRGKKVLEIGGLGFYDEYIASNFAGWRTPRLKELAKSFVSIDIDTRHIELAREHGFEYFVFGDIEEYASLKVPGLAPHSFDVVLMIDVIEHLNNVGKAMHTIKELLAPGGIVAISTPNPWSFNNVLNLFRRKAPSVLEDHTYYVVERNFMQIMRRNKFRIKEIIYYTSANSAHRIKQAFVKAAGAYHKLFHSHILVISEHA